MRLFYTILLLSLSNILMGQTDRIFIGVGGFAKHSFPNNDANRELNILEYQGTSSRTYFLEPAYEFTVGIRFAERFDLLTGINSETGHLHSSPFNYELNYQQISFPLHFRYHFGSNQTYSNFLTIGVNFGKISYRVLSRYRSTWQHDYLEDWNDVSPFSIEFGVGRSFSVTEKSNMILNPFISYELSKNDILKGFYAPIILGVRVASEFKLK